MHLAAEAHEMAPDFQARSSEEVEVQDYRVRYEAPSAAYHQEARKAAYRQEDQTAAYRQAGRRMGDQRAALQGIHQEA